MAMNIGLLIAKYLTNYLDQQGYDATFSMLAGYIGATAATALLAAVGQGLFAAVAWIVGNTWVIQWLAGPFGIIVGGLALAV